jgi:hypothetical protein
MCSKNSLLLICFFSFSYYFVKAEVAFNINERDSFVSYHFIGFKENANDIKVILKLSPLNNKGEKIVDELKRVLKLKSKSLKIVTLNNEWVNPEEVVIEDYMEYILLIYYIPKVKIETITKLEFINKEFKLKL